VTLSRRGSRPGTSLARPLLEFVAVGVVTVALVGFGASILLSRALLRSELREAEAEALSIVGGPVEASLSDGVITGEPGAVALLDGEVRREVLGQVIVAVKLRLPDGRYVYSTDPGIVGTSKIEDPKDFEALRTGKVTADISRLEEADDAPERALHIRLFEVYSVVRTATGQPLLLETYVRYSGVDHSARTIFFASLPALLGALAVLEAVQVPLALAMGRRVRRAERRQEQLLEHAVAASDVERRRIVGDLHDGVVQELAGLNFSLTRVADRMDATGDTELGATLRQAAITTRRSIQALRNLLVDIYPANLREEGLSTALHDLTAATMSSAETDVFVDPSLELTPRTEALVYRAAQEAVRNAARHSGAGTLAVRVTREGDDVVLDVADDGCGFDPASVTVNGRSEGHLGLRLLSELASGAGGRLAIDSSPGAGTRVRFEAPL